VPHRVARCDDGPVPTEPSREPARLRSGHLGLMQLVGQSFSIGPLIDIALFLGIVAALAGAIGPLAVALAALGMATFSLVVAFYASDTGGAGAMGDYMARAWGPTAGVGALGVYVLSLLFSGAAGFGIVVGELVSRFSALYFSVAFPWWAGALVVCGAAWWLNVRGASLATKVQLTIVAVSVIPFLLTAAAAVIHAGPANTWSVFSWGNPHRGDLFGALLFCILLFGGFETVSSLAEEARSPRRSIPIALVATVAGCAGLLVFCSYAGTVYYGPENVARTWGDAVDGFAVMGGELLGPWAAFWIRLALLVDFSATCIGFTVAALRGIYSLARAGYLPRWLAGTNNRGAPGNAATLVLGCAVAVILAGLRIPPADRFATLFVAATAQGLLLVLVYTGLAVGAIRLLVTARTAQPWWRWIVFPLATVVPGLALYGSFVPFPTYPERFGLYSGLAALVLVALWLTVIAHARRRNRSAGESTGRPAAPRLPLPAAIMTGMADADIHPELRRVARVVPRRAVYAWSLPLLRRLPAVRGSRDDEVDVVTLPAGGGARLYRPPAAGGARPALLWIHGGGYVLGNAAQDDVLCRSYVERLGVVVAAAEYRLAPEHPYPTPLEDCYRALTWLAGLPGVDPGRIVIAGASAGGGLAAALAFLARDRGEVSPVLQVLSYPMLDDRTTDPALDRRGFRLWNSASNRIGWRSYLQGADPAVAVPARRTDLAGLPPAWLGVGTLDLFHDEDLAYAERLRGAGVPCELHVVPGAFHGFDALAPRTSIARAYLDATCAAMRAATGAAV
jgi:acetyl esterase/lipase/amino acid transporter